jgi:NAD+ diphosphatase
MDHHARSLLNWFSAHRIDRIAHRRGDETWIREMIRAPQTVFIPVLKGANLFSRGPVRHPVLLPAHALRNSFLALEHLTLLGERDGTAYFLLDLSAADAGNIPIIKELGSFENLREMSPVLDSDQAALLAYARALSIWHGNHQFCSACGSRTTTSRAGHLRLCANVHCGRSHFPRTDPAIIVLVATDSYCLLGRQPSWRPHMYSTIAGFVEPGETLEQAVIREVKEETGVGVEQIHYHSSQPWPFPSSIMLGFTAKPISANIQLQDNELEDARWFAREEVLAAKRKQGALRLPPKFSIARRLIEDWLVPNTA